MRPSSNHGNLWEVAVGPNKSTEACTNLIVESGARRPQGLLHCAVSRWEFLVANSWTRGAKHCDLSLLLGVEVVGRQQSRSPMSRVN